MLDIFNKLKPLYDTSFNGAAVTNGTKNGMSFDTMSVGGGANAAVALLIANTVTDGTHTPKMQHSDDGSSWADVPANMLQGALTPLTSGGGNGSNTVRSFGYLGTSRFLRMQTTTTGATTGAALQVAWVASLTRNYPIP